VGYFDLIVSEATTPNNNPWFSDEWYIDGLPISNQAIIEVDSQQEYALGVRLPIEAIEIYEYVNSNGETEIRRESPWVAWYTTAGEQTEDITLFPYLDADWRAPYCPAVFDAANQIPACDGIEGTWYAVVRDRRGGMAFKQQAFRVRPE
jgi:hypothetical protein